MTKTIDVAAEFRSERAKKAAATRKRNIEARKAMSAELQAVAAKLEAHAADRKARAEKFKDSYAAVMASPETPQALKDKLKAPVVSTDDATDIRVAALVMVDKGEAKAEAAKAAADTLIAALDNANALIDAAIVAHPTGNVAITIPADEPTLSQRFHKLLIRLGTWLRKLGGA